MGIYSFVLICGEGKRYVSSQGQGAFVMNRTDAPVFWRGYWSGEQYQRRAATGCEAVRRLGPARSDVLQR